MNNESFTESFIGATEDVIYIAHARVFHQRKIPLRLISFPKSIFYLASSHKIGFPLTYFMEAIFLASLSQISIDMEVDNGGWLGQFMTAVDS